MVSPTNHRTQKYSRFNKYFQAKPKEDECSRKMPAPKILKNILGELDGDTIMNGNTLTSNGSAVAPKPLKVIKKQATHLYIEKI